LLAEEDLAKVPKGLSLREYYAQIYNWYMKNKDKILIKLAHKSKNDPYITCYYELMKVIPAPNEATMEDIAVICREVVAGLMEWAYHEEDENGVKMGAYAHYILDTFFDGFHGELARDLSRKSKLYEYCMTECLDRIRKD